MRKVELNTMSNIKYETIKKLVDTNGNKHRAAETLGCSYRSINRLIIVYKRFGKEGFLHGNTFKKPANAKSEELKEIIINLYKDKYYDANFVHFNELLKRIENINVSDYFIYKLFRSINILAPECTKRVYKKTQEIIKAKIDNKKKLTTEEQDLIVSRNILDPEENHARIPRTKYFGERVEIDASNHNWFGKNKSTLHGAIDCSTGAILALYFDKEETLKGYYGMFNQILMNYGAPYQFVADNRSVFIHNGLNKKNRVLEKNTKTQFGYACSLLGTNIKTSSIPQHKPRIEKLWHTLQKRLPVEFRVANIKTIEEANEFLNQYIPNYNLRFALPINYTTSVMELIDKNKINDFLSIYTTRSFKASTLKYNNKFYQAYKNDKLVNFKDKVEALVIKTYDNRMICNVDETIYKLVELLERRENSKEFDLKSDVKKKSNWVPPMDHPWKKASFLNYLKNH